MDQKFFTTHRYEVKVLSFLLGGLSLAFAASFVSGAQVERGDVSVPSKAAYEQPFPEVMIQAKAAYVYDVRNEKVLYAKNENVRLPLASLTKVMTALVASELAPAYNDVVISADALATLGDSGLVLGERWTLKDLLDFSLITSSNDGMRAVALSLGALSRSNASPSEIVNDFISIMNKKAEEIGLKNTHFSNETGLDELSQAGAYGTAKDVNTLLSYILFNNPDLFEATKDASKVIWSSDNYPHFAQNTNIIVSEIPGIVASKTGFTDAAGGNLAVVFDPELGRPIIISVLGSTSQGRFDDMKILVAQVLEYIIED